MNPLIFLVGHCSWIVVWIIKGLFQGMKLDVKQRARLPVCGSLQFLEIIVCV